jgi:hypothetical protein
MIRINRNPSPRDLRWFGLVLGAFFGVAGLLAGWRFDAPGVGRGLWVAGAGLAAVYYAVRPLRRAMFVGWMALVFPIGWTVSHVLLGAAYYFVLTPVGLLLRVLGRDPLRRRFEPGSATYWIEHRPDEGGVERYFRQF